MQRFLRGPIIGCDGTFSVLSSNPTEDLTYELNTMVAKDIQLGQVFHVYRNISPRKTITAIINMFDEWVEGLQYPLTPQVHERLSICTDFQTTFAISFRR